MLDTVKINHVQHISFTQPRLTDAVSVILRELLSYEHPSKTEGRFCMLQVNYALNFSSFSRPSLLATQMLATASPTTFREVTSISMGRLMARMRE